MTNNLSLKIGIFKDEKKKQDRYKAEFQNNFVDGLCHFHSA